MTPTVYAGLGFFLLTLCNSVVFGVLGLFCCPFQLCVFVACSDG